MQILARKANVFARKANRVAVGDLKLAGEPPKFAGQANCPIANCAGSLTVDEQINTGKPIVCFDPGRLLSVLPTSQSQVKEWFGASNPMVMSVFMPIWR